LILSGAFYPDLKSGFGAGERIKEGESRIEMPFKQDLTHPYEIVHGEPSHLLPILQ